MRTFRAWDLQNKIMHNDFQFIASGQEGNDWIVFISDKQKLDDEQHPFKNPYFRQQFKIMDFTGVINKQGKGIFVGDVVRCPKGWLGVVRYYPSTANFACEEIVTNIVNSHGPIFDSWDELEVIGNEIQNPGLLDPFGE